MKKIVLYRSFVWQFTVSISPKFERSLKFQRLFGQRVKNRRKALGLTQAGLADKVRMSRSALANVETGEQRTSIVRLAELARVLEIPPGDLLPDLEDAEAQTARKIPVSANGKTDLLDKELRKYNKALDRNLDPDSALQEIRQSSNLPPKHQSHR